MDIIRKLTEKCKVIKASTDKHGEGYRIVNYWFELLEIGVLKAKKYISNHFRGEKDKYDSAFCSINLFKHGMKFVSVDRISNRLHCNLTNSDAKLRQFLSIDKVRLAQVDISNSQPLFLGMIMKNVARVEVAELDKYLGLVCSGNFMNTWQREYCVSFLDLKDDVVRKKFKKSVFSGVLFDRNRTEFSKHESLFQKEFPTIFAEVRKIKAKNYKEMAIILQKKESSFIFNAVAMIDREIGQGKAPLLTIHDSIVSTWEYIYIVEQIMKFLF